MACLLTGWLDAIAHVFCISVRHNLLSFTHSSEEDGKFVSNERSRSSRLFFFRACLHANPRVIVHSTQLQYGTVHTSSHTSKSIQKIKMDSCQIQKESPYYTAWRHAFFGSLFLRHRRKPSKNKILFIYLILLQF